MSGSTLALAHAVSIPVIASGGLASLRDVERILQSDCAKLAGDLPVAHSMMGVWIQLEALTLIRQAQSKSGV